jgi:hypothetical protein
LKYNDLKDAASHAEATPTGKIRLGQWLLWSITRKGMPLDLIRGWKPAIRPKQFRSRA